MRFSWISFQFRTINTRRVINHIPAKFRNFANSMPIFITFPCCEHTQNWIEHFSWLKLHSLKISSLYAFWWFCSIPLNHAQFFDFAIFAISICTFITFPCSDHHQILMQHFSWSKLFLIKISSLYAFWWSCSMPFNPAQFSDLRFLPILSAFLSPSHARITAEF